jgi:Mrp family chromosome partitioning ATPase
MKEARENFDYIILDNPPVSFVTDGILIGRHADVNLFLLREGYSHREQIKFINNLVEKKTINKIALVLNDVKVSGLGYRYSLGGYNYESGNKYYGVKYDNDMQKNSFLKKIVGSIKNHRKFEIFL